MEEHDEKLKKVLNLINEAGLKQNVKTFAWRQPEIAFLCNNLARKAPDQFQKKLRAIV